MTVESDSGATSAGTHSWRRGGAWMYVAAWLPYFFLYMAAFMARDCPMGLAARSAFAGVLPGALLGIGVLRLPQGLSWPEGAKLRFFAIHLGLLVTFALACMLLWAVLVGVDALIFEGAFRIQLDPRALPWAALFDLLIYCTLAGLSYAWHNAETGRRQAARAARAESLRARAELEALRSQLNPHFILNTFHALVGLVRREPEVAEEALERLGDLLRYSIRVQREGLDEVTLREEWAFVSAYLDLERLRLGQRLRVEFDADPNVLEWAVPTFSVQTLVENAVRHAITPRAEGGKLTVRVRQVNDRLRIEVEDEGPGHAVSPPVESQGVGLKLLRERLAALYEGQADLSREAVAGGLCAVIELPNQRGLEKP